MSERGPSPPFRVVMIERTLATRAALGDGWRSFRSFLTGWDTAAPGVNPDPEGTRELVGFLFGAGLEFITGSNVDIWQASKARIDGVAGSPSRLATLQRLSGMGFFQGIVTAQAKFGDVLGLTAVPAAEQAAEVRTTRDELHEVMRRYLVTAVAFANPLRPGSEEVSAALLEPANRWESPETASSASTAENGSGGGETGEAAGDAGTLPN